jgi:hypothetical protein
MSVSSPISKAGRNYRLVFAGAMDVCLGRIAQSEITSEAPLEKETPS